MRTIFKSNQTRPCGRQTAWTIRLTLAEQKSSTTPQRGRRGGGGGAWHMGKLDCRSACPALGTLRNACGTPRWWTKGRGLVRYSGTVSKQKDTVPATGCMFGTPSLAVENAAIALSRRPRGARYKSGTKRGSTMRQARVFRGPGNNTALGRAKHAGKQTRVKGPWVEQSRQYSSCVICDSTKQRLDTLGASGLGARPLKPSE